MVRLAGYSSDLRVIQYISLRLHVVKSDVQVFKLNAVILPTEQRETIGQA